MNVKVLAVACGAAAASAALAAWVYEDAWPRPGSPKIFERPGAIAVVQIDRFYVTDIIDDRVFLVTPPNYIIIATHGSGPGQVDCPWGAGLNAAGTLYITDCDNHRIQYLTGAGSFLGSWPFPGESVEWGGANLTVAPNGYVYVVYPLAKCVFYYTATGSCIGSWGSQGSGPGQFQMPTDIAVSSNMTVYVTDNTYNRVQYFTYAGSYIGQWGSTGYGPGQFRELHGIGIAPNGTVFCTDLLNDRVQYFTPVGSFLGSWGFGGSGAGALDEPCDVAVDPTGTHVYVADLGNSRVSWFVEDTNLAPASLGKIKALFQ